MCIPWALRFNGDRTAILTASPRVHEFPLMVECHKKRSRRALGTLTTTGSRFVNIEQPLTANAVPPASIALPQSAYVRCTVDPKALGREFGEVVSPDQMARNEHLTRRPNSKRGGAGSST